MANSQSGENPLVTPPAKGKQRRPWPADLSDKLCREVFFLRPYSYPPRSNERKDTWNLIYDNLWSLPDFKTLGFELKAVKDHLDGLIRKRAAEVKKESTLTGLGDAVDKTPLQDLLDQLSEDIEKETELQTEKTDAKRTNDEKEKEKAVEVRQKAMESMGETRKRNRENGDSETTPPSAKRRSGTETLMYLQEKSAALQKSKEEEARLKKEELELRRSEMNNSQTLLQTMEINRT